MTRDDRPEDRPGEDVARDEDPDRAAILARRRRFVAIALSGLAAGTGCTPKPEPCLKVAPPDDSSSGRPDPGPTSGQPEAAPVEPQPCLKIAPPSEPPPEVPAEPEPTPEAEPQPCLKVAPPAPEPEPRPCLKVRRPDPEPAPRPCLSVRKPDK